MHVIWYVYPMWHRVSFSLIAERHVEQLRKYFKRYTIDERVLNILSPATNPLLIIHPYFYPMSRYAKHIERLLARVRGIIGIDVADSDRISNVAVSMTHYAECMIVPSKWSKEAYVRSGVKTPVHILPHGLDQSWYTDPPRVQFFKNLLDRKRRHKLKYLLYFCWHSEYRKGLDLVESYASKEFQIHIKDGKYLVTHSPGADKHVKVRMGDFTAYLYRVESLPIRGEDEPRPLT